MLTPADFVEVFGVVALDFLLTTTPPVMMFCMTFKRRPHYWLRLLFVVAFIFVYGLLMTAIEACIELYIYDGGNGPFNLYPQYMLLLLGVFLIQLFLYHASAPSLLFSLLGGYALHEIGLFLFDIIYDFTDIIPDCSILSLEYHIYRVIWYTLVLFVFYHILIKRQNAVVVNDITNNQPTFYLSLGMSLFLLAFNLVRAYAVERQTTLDLMCIICLILFYTLILLFRSSLLKTIETEKEIALKNKVWEEKEKSLTLTMGAVNAINIKYHDLKHILPRLKSGGDINEYVNEVTNSLKAFEEVISTGNDALDMVLTEQSLKCRRNGIDFSCMADGGCISFMSSVEIISLFSNALDNACEAVLPLEKEYRQICLTIKQAIGMVSVCVENPCFTEPLIRNGLPVTSKHDREYHGFGMKSMRAIAEKYGGDMSVSIEDHWFRLNMLFPVD